MADSHQATTGLAEAHDAADEVRDFSLFTPCSQAELYAKFGRMQQSCPVGRSEALGGYWVVTSNRLMAEILRDPETYSSRITTVPPYEDPLGPMIPIEIDPPDHTAYRKDLQRMFSPAVANGLAEATRERAKAYVERLSSLGTAEVVGEFCEPYPAATFCLLLGVPLAALDQLLYWKNAILHDGFGPDPEKREYVAKVVRPTVAAYFGSMVELRREQGDDAPNDVLRALAHARFGDRPWTENEVLRTTHLLMSAGLDTTSAALAMAMQYLAQHPDLQQRLKDEPEVRPNAVEEFLRLFSSITTGRVVTRDTELGGVQLHEGDLLNLVTPAAGRDPEDYPHPHVVDLDRGPTRHLAFGVGPHRCLGSHIARMSLTVAIEEMTALPEYRLAEGTEPTFHPGLVLGIDDLWIEFDKPAGVAEHEDAAARVKHFVV